MSNDTCQGTQRYGDTLRISWRCQPTARTCQVEVWWKDSLIMPATLDAQHPKAQFSAADESDPRQQVKGEFQLDALAGELELVYLSYPGGEVRHQRLCPREGPSPPIPPPEPVDDESLIGPAIIGPAARDLFPYVFLRGWPAAPSSQATDRFVRYPGADTCLAGDLRFYCQLLAIDRTAPNAREAMMQRSAQFIEGRLASAGKFVPDAAALAPPFDSFASLRAKLLTQRPLTLASVVDTTTSMLGMTWQDIADYLASAAFATECDQAWQSLFALIIESGYDRGGLAQLIGSVVMAALLQRLTQDPNAPDPAQWSASRLGDVLEATVVLPGPAFPLPPAGQPDRLSAKPSVLPFAIGELQLVRERLVRYELGEVGHIENVMPGERKTRRHWERQREDIQTQTVAVGEYSSDDLLEGRSEAFEQCAQREIREQFRLDFSTTYGPPQEATAAGYEMQSANPENVPNRQRLEAREALARSVTRSASRRYAHSLSALRSERLRRDLESETGHCIDRRGQQTGCRGVYRWVNAVHRCWIEPVGLRLMLELFIPEPARDFIAARLQLSGTSLNRPMPLTAAGVDTFEDIAIEPGSEAYYATLAARYGVNNVEPPPPATQTQSVVFETDPPVSALVLTLPEGYLARQATVLFASTDPAQQARVSVGGAAAVVGQSPVPAQAPAPAIALAGQRGTLPVAFALTSGDSSGPTALLDHRSSDTPGTSGSLEIIASRRGPSRFTLTVQIQCDASPSLLARWRSQVYARLQEGYRQQLAAYLDATGIRQQPNWQGDQLAWRTIARDETTRRGLREFIEVARNRTGQVGRIHRFLPALAVWLERVLEWPRMTVSFVDCLPESGLGQDRVIAGPDAGLAGFLQASHARVLLPVAPGRELTVLYYLATGVVWNDSDTLAPTLDATVAGDGDSSAGCGSRWIDVVNAWKEAAGPCRPATSTSEPWHVVLPTTLSVLQEGESLPEFGP
ncbi:MAG: hypothetical protein U1A22_11575 [Xanthomonadaceae bacterium]|nr:hypothetical protein [Xanthomonadaceae bacterium]